MHLHQTRTAEMQIVNCPFRLSMVRSRRLELPRVAPQRPQRCASTNSATTARDVGRSRPAGRHVANRIGGHKPPFRKKSDKLRQACENPRWTWVFCGGIRSARYELREVK